MRALALISLLLMAGTAYAEPIDQERLCQAIYRAENSKAHPYGIMQKYKTTTPRQACINTVNSAIKRYKADSKGMDFISFLGMTYCPLSDPRDTSGVNKNWISNTRYFYEKM